MKAALETMSMDAIMRRWPETIHVVLHHHMLCVGCPLAPFQSVAEACRDNGVDKARFLEDVRCVIEAKGGPA